METGSTGPHGHAGVTPLPWHDDMGHPEHRSRGPTHSADMAMDHGITFWDTAEVYPTNPVTAEKAGNTERIIGTCWPAAAARDRIQIATKVTAQGIMAVRSGAPITVATIRAALEGSLRRLGTDYVDLYQLPAQPRPLPLRQSWSYTPKETDSRRGRGAYDGCSGNGRRADREGKIRAIGLSNGNRLGAGLWLHLSELHGLPTHGVGAERIFTSLPAVRYRLVRDVDLGGHAVSSWVFAPRGRGGLLCRASTRGDVIPEQDTPRQHARSGWPDHATGLSGRGGLHGHRGRAWA